MWGLYVDYSGSALRHMCNVVDIFAQGHMPVMWNACIPVVLAKLFIAVSS